MIYVSASAEYLNLYEMNLLSTFDIILNSSPYSANTILQHLMSSADSSSAQLITENVLR